jgi:16S rRNA processing protein RimM
MSEQRGWLRAGRIGSPHGLDGSFHVLEPLPQLLTLGASVTVGDPGAKPATITRRAGTDQRPILRLEGYVNRDAAAALRGAELLVARSAAPELEQDEWWAEELEGCAVRDRDVVVGTVRRMLVLPSCEVLEVERTDGAGELLVPLIADAVREVDVEGRRIEIDLRFLGES